MRSLLFGGGVAVAVGFTLACGGGAGPKKQVKEPIGQETDSPADAAISAETEDEIRRLFQRKGTILARCFPESVETGEVNAKDVVTFTVNTTITKTGKPSGTEVLASSTESDALKRCVIRKVNSWTFPKVPQPVERSHPYTLREF